MLPRAVLKGTTKFFIGRTLTNAFFISTLSLNLWFPLTINTLFTSLSLFFADFRKLLVGDGSRASLTLSAEVCKGFMFCCMIDLIVRMSIFIEFKASCSCFLFSSSVICRWFNVFSVFNMFALWRWVLLFSHLGQYQWTANFFDRIGMIQLLHLHTSRATSQGSGCLRSSCFCF